MVVQQRFLVWWRGAVVLRTRKKKTELWWCCGAGSRRCRCRRGGYVELLEQSCGGDGTVARWLRRTASRRRGGVRQICCNGVECLLAVVRNAEKMVAI
ncbi:hypothetical protein DEO72_LG10g1510 [Vigna unguiculata]|uniref:Uncharacterized protein n=1 Tax=Vigna unguiculata TaxID=3917 RepID=A0A4D6NBM3_VIGUN|nr:hypothetical protein DEO72_LG10g1510 [Vigna unguiculata]